MGAVVALAFHTGISVESWLNGDQRAMWTAIDLLKRQSDEYKKGGRR